MTVTVIPSRKNKKLYTVQVKQGCQYFRLDYHASRKDAHWYANQFRTALRKSEQERHAQEGYR